MRYINYNTGLPGSPSVQTNFEQHFALSLCFALAHQRSNCQNKVIPSRTTMRTAAVPQNLILFITDQERAHNLNYSKDFDEKESLPGTEWLKKNGLSFSNSFTNTNQCSASRATFFTSKFPAQHEVMEVITSDNWQNPQTQAQTGLDPRLPNLATALKTQGYDVVYKGKAHLNIGYNRTNGTARPIDDNYIDPDLSLLGFDEWQPPEAGTFHNPWGIRNINYLKNPKSKFYENDQRFTDEAIEWISDRRESNNDKPFALIVSLVNPHDILAYPDPRPFEEGEEDCKAPEKCTPDPRELAYLLGYTDSDFSNKKLDDQPIPLTIKDDPKKLYKPDAQSYFLEGMDREFAPMQPKLAKDYLNFYANLVRRSDEMLESIINTINEDQDFANDTMIVKISDHGELGLAHGGMRQKTWNAYDEAIKVPTIWSNSKFFKNKSKNSDALISTIDFLPTYLNLINTDKDIIKSLDLRGKDYSSILNGKPDDIQDHILFSWDDDWAGQDPNGLRFKGKDPQLGGIPAPSKIHMLRTKDFKLVRFYDPSKPYNDQIFQEEFYDLRANGSDYSKERKIPLERKNYSPWAENLRQKNDENTISNRYISKQYEELTKELDQQIEERLQPLPKQHGCRPQYATRLTKDGRRVTMLEIHQRPKKQSSELELAFSSHSQQYYRVQILESYNNKDREPVRTWTTLGGGVIKGTNNPIYMYFKGLPRNLKKSQVRVASVFTKAEGIIDSKRDGVPKLSDDQFPQLLISDSELSSRGIQSDEICRQHLESNQLNHSDNNDSLTSNSSQMTNSETKSHQNNVLPLNETSSSCVSTSDLDKFCIDSNNNPITAVHSDPLA